MSHNPLAAELEQVAAELESLRARRTDLGSSLDWYSSFDRAATEQRVKDLQNKRGKLEERLGDTTDALGQAKQRTSVLKSKTRWGQDPRRWLPNVRAKARRQFAAHKRKLADLEARRTELVDKLDKTDRKLTKATAVLAEYDGFDVAAATEELAALDAEIAVRQPEHEDLAVRKERLDQQLEGAVESLTELQTDLRRATSKRSSLRSDVDRYERDIKKAQKLDKALADAWDGRERYEVHKECEDEFNDGSPGRVLKNRRRKLNEARHELSSLERRIPGLERNVAKAEQRVATIVARGTRDIRTIVIDGNNLCYAEQKFIGSAALRPLCLHLREKYDVTLVFDNSIRRLLTGSSDEKHWITDADLRERFPGVTLHVVPARTQADETILAASVDPTVYVLSNDRFAEYRDKPAVREGRLITHEILNGQVLVHDLDVSVSITPGP